MTKTDDEIIEEVVEWYWKKQDMEMMTKNPIAKKAQVGSDLWLSVDKALSLKQNQQDELLNKFNEKVDAQIKGWGYYTHDKKAIEIFEKSKQLAKEVFTKTKEG